MKKQTLDWGEAVASQLRHTACRFDLRYNTLSLRAAHKMFRGIGSAMAKGSIDYIAAVEEAKDFERSLRLVMEVGRGE